MTSKIVASTILVLYLAAFASACSCLFEEFETSYYRLLKAGRPITLAKVLKTKITSTGGSFPIKTRVYTLKVLKVYAGCARATPYKVIATSPFQSATCGVFLKTGSTYLVALKKFGVSSLVSCDPNILQANITPAIQDFLNKRYLCCKGSCRCAGSTIFNCFVAPCKFSKPPCAEATKCVNNYCGGCNAEWFNKAGLPACKFRPF